MRRPCGDGYTIVLDPENGRLASEMAKAMKGIEPCIELVAFECSFRRLPSYVDWEATALDVKDFTDEPYVDAVAVHNFSKHSCM